MFQYPSRRWLVWPPPKQNNHVSIASFNLAYSLALILPQLLRSIKPLIMIGPHDRNTLTGNELLGRVESHSAQTGKMNLRWAAGIFVELIDILGLNVVPPFFHFFPFIKPLCSVFFSTEEPISYSVLCGFDDFSRRV